MTIALPIAAAIIRDITERRIAEATDAHTRAGRETTRRSLRRRQPVKD